MKNTSRRSHHAWTYHYKVEANSINYTAASINIFTDNHDNDNTNNNPDVTNYRTFTLCTECKTNHCVRLYMGTKSLNVHRSTVCITWSQVIGIQFHLSIYDTSTKLRRTSQTQNHQYRNRYKSVFVLTQYGHGAKKPKLRAFFNLAIIWRWTATFTACNGC
jgi:hypothetical protein